MKIRINLNSLLFGIALIVIITGWFHYMRFDYDTRLNQMEKIYETRISIAKTNERVNTVVDVSQYCIDNVNENIFQFAGAVFQQRNNTVYMNRSMMSFVDKQEIIMDQMDYFTRILGLHNNVLGGKK